jgi:hypothetical protein
MADSDPGTPSTETPADFGKDPGAEARRWISEIDLAEKAQAAWREQGRKIIRQFVREKTDSPTETSRTRRFALLWSNIETLQPAVLARTPTAVVGRRWKDEDAVGRVASEVLERALNFGMDCLDFADILLGLRDDFLLVGRGQAWVRYVPHMQTMTATAAPEGQVTNDQYEVVGWEEVVIDHVNWDDFLHSPARQWAEVRWAARIAYLTRDELVSRFGAELGKAIPLDHAADSDKGGPEDSQFKKAAIYEIWDKPSRRAIWISKAYPDRALDARKDPLGLQDFFPCPRPVLATTGPDSIIPTPDFAYYEGQARDINALTERIGLLNDAIKMRGFYAAGGEGGKDLEDLFSKDSGTLIPVDSWAAFASQGGVKGLIEWIPIDMVVMTLKGCIEARTQLVNDVYQITGIADILRGDVDPDETATATRTKANWGSSRVRDKQKELARFARDVLRIMGQVIAAKFSPQTLSAMTNVKMLPSPEAKQQLMKQLQAEAQQAQMAAARAQAMGQPPPPPFRPDPAMQAMLDQPTWQEVMGLLRDNTLRTFRIDIETDSTIEPNDQEEKQRRVEFVGAVGEYVSKSIPAVQLMPQLLPVIGEGLKFLVRGFRVGREMEETIEKALDQLEAAAQGGQGQQQQHGPDPKAEQAKAQAAQMTAQARVMDAQTNQQRAQTDRFAAQAGAQIEDQRLQIENQHAHLDRQADFAMHREDLANDLQQAVGRAVERTAVHDMMDRRPISAPTR